MSAARKSVRMNKRNVKRISGRTIAAVSLGCSKNLVDTEVMLGAFAQAGYSPVSNPEEADILVVNTCGFISDAVQESESVIEELTELKRTRGDMKLIVAGCLAERARDVLRRKFPEIDLLIGASSYIDIVRLIESNAAECFKPLVAQHDHTNPRLLATPPWSAYLKIADGCSNSCSYCMIPKLRGCYRSRTPDSLVHEAESLAGIGVREIVLVAQDVTRYGADLSGRTTLSGLLEKISDVDGIHWIRIMYAYPGLVDDKLVRTMSKLPEVCRYIDMPIQHIDDRILKRMNRRGGRDAIVRAVGLLRDAMPDICIRTTVLVGFPGETDAQFGRLMEFVEAARFDRLGAFSYSAEEETPAARLPRRIPDDVKESRRDAIMRLQQKISFENNCRFIGDVLEVLTEGTAVTGKNISPERRSKAETNVGRTYRDAPEIDGVVRFGGTAVPGEFTAVLIEDADEYDLFGTVLR